MAELGNKVKEDKAASIEAALAGELAPDEVVWLIIRANGLKPFIDHIVVTSGRVIGVWFEPQPVLKKQVFSDEFTSESVARALNGNRYLELKAPDGSTVKFGVVTQKEDVPRLLQVLEHLRLHGRGPDARQHHGAVVSARNAERAAELAVQEADAVARQTEKEAKRAEDAAVKQAARDAKKAANEEKLASFKAQIAANQAEEAGILAAATLVSSNVGGGISGKALTEIRKHTRPGERPWFILSSGVGGVLVAFDDRLMIIKTGAMTSLMSGSLGGGRSTTFNFHDITGIEYNSGFANGVLEVLTASYQGTSNKDYWRGSTRGRNANSDDPFTLSNTLPLDKATHSRAFPQLNELRARIADAKRPTVVVQSSSPGESSTPSVTEELAKVAELHSAGVLSDEEFAEAKNALLARLRSGG